MKTLSYTLSDKNRVRVYANWEPGKIFGSIIKYLSSNTSCFIVCEAKCFGPYMMIIRPSYESSQEMLATLT